MSEGSVVDDENRQAISKSRGKRVAVTSNKIQPIFSKKKNSPATFKVTTLDEIDERNDNICYALAKFRCNGEEEVPLHGVDFLQSLQRSFLKRVALIIFLLLMACAVLQILVSLTQFFHKA